MISIRSFRNDDLRSITEIWNHQHRSRGRLQPLTCQILETEVLSKPYFDRHQLNVAVAEGVPVGFAHTGFAANADGMRLSHDTGIICALQVLPRPDRDQIGEQLLQYAERELVSSGAARLQGGCVRSAAPFYAGLYGGCVPAGVLVSDAWLLELLNRSGYTAGGECLIYQRSAQSFRPAIERTRLQIRRRHIVQVSMDLPASNWWEACQRGNADVTRLTLSPRDEPSRAVAALSLCEPTGLDGQRTVGIVDWEFVDEAFVDGTAEFVVAEAISRSGQQGATRVEIQVIRTDQPMQELAEGLGFEMVDRGLVLARELCS